MPEGLFARVRSFCRGFIHPSRHDADLDVEMRFHLDMETQRLIDRGVDPALARRRAAAAFGGVHKYRGAVLDAIGLSWVRGISLDLKLGLRMLVKYPGLTLVALFALSLAIGAGAAYLEFINDLMHGRLPFDEPDRIVGIQTWDQETGRPDHRSTADFVAWRGTLRSFQDLAAYRTPERNLTTDDGRIEPVSGAEISASAFRIARVPPLIGRPLVPDDERPGAAPVVVLGFDLWRTRFAADRGIVGRTVNLEKAQYTVVGVMPEGFGLPVSHNLWMPLPLNDAHYPRRDGPATRIFGRLAPDASLRDAQAELEVIVQRNAAAFPETDGRIQPVVKPYVESFWSAVEDARMQTVVFYSANVFFIALLLLCGANIATLVFARTASRDMEIGVRTALGASRARIAGQLFAEALVLSSMATVLGLAVGAAALRWVKHTIIATQGEPLMFWWNDRLALPTIVYAAVLAVVSAAIIGIIPALKATSPRIQQRLKQGVGGSAAGFRFGGVWTGVIVSQVAITVVFFAVVSLLGWGAYVTSGGERKRSFPAAEYVSALLKVDQAAQTTYRELARRLAAEPAVAGVTYAARLPGTGHQTMTVEIDGVSSESASMTTGSLVRTTAVAPNFFDVFQAPIVAGRRFEETDLAPGHDVAIVDRTFVRRVLQGQNAIGRLVRDVGEQGAKPGPWIEIVGVVADLTDETNKPPKESVIYRPASLESMRPVHIAVHARTNPSAILSRLRVVAGDIDPAMRVTELQTLDEVNEQDRITLDFFTRLIAGVSVVALILAAAGVYALMSFTVARRTAEIGIRLALGASPRRVVLATFGRALLQVGLGLLVGAIPAALLAINLGPGISATAERQEAIAACIVATLVVAGITSVASLVPVRRALHIQPVDALKVS